MRDVHGSVGSPSRLEVQPGYEIRFLDSKPVVDIDQCAVARARPVVAAVIGPQHVDAGAVQLAQWDAGLYLPWAIAHQHALAFGSARPSEGEAAGPIRDRKADAAPLRVGLAEIAGRSVGAGDRQAIERDRSADGCLVVIHAVDPDFRVARAGREDKPQS